MGYSSSVTISPLERSERFWGLVMIAPLVLGMLVFSFIPFCQNIFYSFTDLGDFEIWTEITLDNYRLLWEDPEFYKALLNTLFFVAICVPCTVFISLMLALGLNQKLAGLSAFRTLLFLPAITMPTAIAMVWKWVYNCDFGLINLLLAKFGIESIAWLSDPQLVRYSTALVIIWSGLALNTIILLAGLQGIPRHLYEAAAIDAAGPIRRFFAITLPMMTPTLFFVSIMCFIDILQIFDLIYLLFQKSLVVEETMSIVYLFYKYAFVYQEKGYASAIAVVLFVITMGITAFQLWLAKRLSY